MPIIKKTNLISVYTFNLFFIIIIIINFQKPMAQLEKFLEIAKDLRVRFAIAMIGNIFILWFLATYFKQFIPNLPPELS